MGWISLITGAFSFLIKLLDFLGSKKPTMRQKINEKRERLQDEQHKFKENLERKNYEEASRQLRDAIDDINAIRRMPKKDNSGSSGESN